ncbi:MAG TPA: hypothetical protein PLN68_08320 [Elusimicrobiales bacterium]|nr:hypothetical protein [Elusimicrobiales bacterium]
MIYFEYEIWTRRGWKTADDLTNYDEILVFNSDTRMSKFIEVKNIKKVLDNKNYEVSNNNYIFLLNEKNNFLDKDFKKFKMKDLSERRNILVDAKTIFIPTNIEENNEIKRFVTFDLKENEFVLIRNVFKLYVNWKTENITNIMEEKNKAKRGRPKILKY